MVTTSISSRRFTKGSSLIEFNKKKYSWWVLSAHSHQESHSCWTNSLEPSSSLRLGGVLEAYMVVSSILSAKSSKLISRRFWSSIHKDFNRVRPLTRSLTKKWFFTCYACLMSCLSVIRARWIRAWRIPSNLLLIALCRNLKRLKCSLKLT